LGRINFGGQRDREREMSEKFSATLRIGDLSDFIAPSQACIVSLKGLKTNPTKPDKAEVFCHNFINFSLSTQILHLFFFLKKLILFRIMPFAFTFFRVLIWLNSY